MYRFLLLIGLVFQLSVSLAETSSEPSLSSSSALEDVPWKEIQHRIEKLFKKLDHGQGMVWNLALTPPLPNSWPPSSSIVWMRYAYARGQDFPPGNLADGEKISSPFLRIELHPDVKSANLVLLATRLKTVGIQGVRPLEPEEANVFRRQSQIEAIVLDSNAVFDLKDSKASDVRGFYRFWMLTNGIIVRELRSFHDPFFQWIEVKTD